MNKPESTKIVNKQEQQRQVDESNLASDLKILQLSDITTSLEGTDLGNSEQSNNFQNNIVAGDGEDHSLSKDEPIIDSMNDTETNNNNSIIIHDSNQIVNHKENEIMDVQNCQEGEDDDIEWITPDNIDKYQAKEQNYSANGNIEDMKIACMTTDYSMQVRKVGLEIFILTFIPA